MTSIIVNRLIKMIYYELVKITINASGLGDVIMDIVIKEHGLLISIMSDRGSLFTSKVWSLLCYFGIKCRLSTFFHPRTNKQI